MLLGHGTSRVMTHCSRDIGYSCWNHKLVKMTGSCGKRNGFGLDRVALCWFKLLNVPSACREWDLSLVPSEPGRDLSRYPLGLRLRASYPWYSG
jgi:hypothetical protein